MQRLLIILGLAIGAGIRFGPIAAASPSPTTASISQESTESVCGFLVLKIFVPTGAIDACNHQTAPAFALPWSAEQTFRYYVKLAHDRHFETLNEFVPGPVAHSVPPSYYNYRLNIVAYGRTFALELAPGGIGTTVTVRILPRSIGAVRNNSVAPSPTPLPFTFNGISLSAPFSRFITAKQAVEIAEKAIFASQQKRLRADAFWARLERYSGGDYVWDVRTTDGVLYPRANLVHFAIIDALSGRLLSLRAQHNSAPEPIPPEATPPPRLAHPTPCPNGVHPCDRGVAKIRAPANASDPIIRFAKTFTNALSLPRSFAYPDSYIVEVKLLPYGVAQRDLKTGVIAFDISTARMYVIQTILVPHPLNLQISVPPGYHDCQRAYAIMHDAQDAATGAPGFGEVAAPCK